MAEDFLTRRKFIAAMGGLTLVGVLSACTTTKSSNQDTVTKKINDLRATKKYAEKKIEVGDNYYSPQEIEIEAGTIVIWENVGRSIHDVMSDDPEGNPSTDVKPKLKNDFTSDTLRSGEKHVWLFEKPGKYYYHCHFHGGPQRGQWGSITVNSTDHTP